MLRIDGIIVRYGRVPALHGVSLTVERGEMVTLIGANGAGKTTTLRAISGLLPLASGQILFEGEPIGNRSPRAILARGIAHCPEGRHVFPQLSVRENLRMGSYLRRDTAAVRRDLDDVLDRFPRLRERLDQAAGTLSGGEQQMLAIARALMSRPKMILFDEPSLGLAPNLVDQTFDIVAEDLPRRHHRADGGAERAGGAGDVRPQLSAGERPDRRARHGAGDAGQSAHPGGVSRRGLTGQAARLIRLARPYRSAACRRRER